MDPLSFQDYFMQFLNKKSRNLTKKLRDISELEKGEKKLLPEQAEKIQNKGKIQANLEQVVQFRDLYLQGIAEYQKSFPTKQENSERLRPDSHVSQLMNLYWIGKFLASNKSDESFINQMNSKLSIQVKVDEIGSILDIYHSIFKDDNNQEMEKTIEYSKANAEEFILKSAVEGKYQKVANLIEAMTSGQLVKEMNFSGFLTKKPVNEYSIQPKEEEKEKGLPVLQLDMKVDEKEKAPALPQLQQLEEKEKAILPLPQSDTKPLVDVKPQLDTKPDFSDVPMDEKVEETKEILPKKAENGKSQEDEEKPKKKRSGKKKEKTSKNSGAFSKKFEKKYIPKEDSEQVKNKLGNETLFSNEPEA